MSSTQPHMRRNKKQNYSRLMDNPAAIPRESLFQRVWPPMVIGVIFVLEVIWIVLLVYLLIALL